MSKCERTPCCVSGRGKSKTKGCKAFNETTYATFCDVCRYPMKNLNIS